MAGLGVRLVVLPWEEVEHRLVKIWSSENPGLSPEEVRVQLPQENTHPVQDEGEECVVDQRDAGHVEEPVLGRHQLEVEELQRHVEAPVDLRRASAVRARRGQGWLERLHSGDGQRRV